MIPETRLTRSTHLTFPAVPAVRCRQGWTEAKTKNRWSTAGQYLEFGADFSPGSLAPMRRAGWIIPRRTSLIEPINCELLLNELLLAVILIFIMYSSRQSPYLYRRGPVLLILMAPITAPPLSARLLSTLIFKLERSSTWQF